MTKNFRHHESSKKPGRPRTEAVQESERADSRASLLNPYKNLLSSNFGVDFIIYNLMKIRIENTNDAKDKEETPISLSFSNCVW